MAGDLNAILAPEEKHGGRNFGSSSHNNFVQDSSVVDLGYNGNPFTWCNKRNGRNKIKERLDRGLSNHNWILLFPEASIKRLPAAASDHNLILIATNSIEAAPKPFKFETFWTQDPSSHSVIASTWNIPPQGSYAFSIGKKLKSSKAALKVGT